MALVSLSCLKFALAVLLLYFIFPGKFRWLVLTGANIFFYCSYGAVYILFILFSSIVSYGGSLILEKENKNSSERLAGITDKAEKEALKKSLMKRKKLICLITILLILSCWIVLKYGNFLASNVISLASLFLAVSPYEKINWILPLGMSFYTFHAIGYVVDIYRKKYPAEKNFIRYFTFLSFFPHMIQGPFSRFSDLSKTLFAPNTFSYERLCEGCARILWGVFKKVVIADPTGSTVNMIIGNYADHFGIQIIFAIFLYGIRLYADFSGYMDIVCGFCRILGVGLEENFKQPFFAKTIDEFWRRWHITLGKWFRDYVFYPVSMSKTGMKLSKWARAKFGASLGKLIPGYFAMIFVWTATGLWHGADWTYLIWGWLNLIVICSTMQLSNFYKNVKEKLHINSDGMLWKIFCMARTYVLVSFFRLFSVAKDLGSAFGSVGKIFTDMNIALITQPSQFLIGMFREEIILMIPAVLMMFTVDILNEKDKWEKVKTSTPVFVRALVYCVMIVMITLMLKGEDMSRGFMYANF